MTAQVHAFEPVEGGAIHVSLTYRDAAGEGKTTTQTDTYRGRFVQLVPDERVVEMDWFETSDPALRGEMTSTIVLSDAADGGTDVLGVHEGLPPGVAVADNETGWRMALARLAALAEADVAAQPASASGALTVEVMREALSVCRLPADASLPEWATRAGAFSSITRTADELSVICASNHVPAAAEGEITARDDGWRALRLVGPFAFTEVGVLLRVAAPLAAAGISILPVATFETDYVLVREARLGAAVAALEGAGHSVVHAPPGRQAS
jgi:uncharacterized protein YndB with AHSA1/START domain